MDFVASLNNTTYLQPSRPAKRVALKATKSNEYENGEKQGVMCRSVSSHCIPVSAMNGFPEVLHSQGIFTNTCRSSEESALRKRQLSVLSYLSVSSANSRFLDISDHYKMSFSINSDLSISAGDKCGTDSAVEVETDSMADNSVNDEDEDETTNDAPEVDPNALKPGDVEITVNHVHKTNLLNVTIHRAKIYPYTDDDCKQVFAKVCLLPNKTQKQTSKYVTRGSSKTWDETFSFKKLTMGELEMFGIRIKFYSKSGLFKKAKKIGTATTQLCDVDIREMSKNILTICPTVKSETMKIPTWNC